MRSSVKCCVLILAVTILAAALRLPRPARRPMHGDEAVHADKFANLLEGDGYEYNPYEYHGPTLNYFTFIPAWLGSVKTYAEMTEFTVRVVPIFFGVLLVLMSVLLFDGLGRWACVCAAVLTAISPAMVYYSRYYIQEMLLVCFSFGVIGFAGSYRLLQAVGDDLADVSSIETLKGMQRLLAALEASMGELGWGRSSDSALPVNDALSLLLVSNRGKIWTVQGDLAIIRHKEYAALGSGYVDARGAMYVAHKTGMAANDAAKIGAECASKHNSGCGGRIYTKEMTW